MIQFNVGINLKEFEKHMKAEEKRHKDAIAKGVYAELEAIKNLSQRYVPRKTGVLAASAHIVKKRNQYAISGDIIYSAPYAFFVHEINKNYTVGHWKFLEFAMGQRANDFDKNVAAHAKKILGE